MSPPSCRPHVNVPTLLLLLLLVLLLLLLLLLLLVRLAGLTSALRSTLKQGTCWLGMKQACKAEVAAAASGDEAAVSACVKCGQAHRAQLQGPVYYTPKKEWLPSACGRNASQVRNDHARFSQHDMSTRSALTPEGSAGTRWAEGCAGRLSGGRVRGLPAADGSESTGGDAGCDLGRQRAAGAAAALNRSVIMLLCKSRLQG